MCGPAWGRVRGRSAPFELVMLGLSGRRRTDRLMVDLAELSSQVSFARAGRLSAQLAGTGATGGQAHHATADLAALLAADPAASEPADHELANHDTSDHGDDPAADGGDDHADGGGGDGPGGRGLGRRGR